MARRGGVGEENVRSGDGGLHNTVVQEERGAKTSMRMVLRTMKRCVGPCTGGCFLIYNIYMW